VPPSRAAGGSCPLTELSLDPVGFAHR